jgi:hypothetical protein
VRSEGQKQSRKHEDRLAKKIGGTRNAGSGSFWLRKGDVRNDRLLIEHKWTGKTQYTIKAQVLETAMKEALLTGRMGVLGVHLNGHDYVILDENDFLSLLDAQECDERSQVGVAVQGQVPDHRPLTGM